VRFEIEHGMLQTLRHKQELAGGILDESSTVAEVPLTSGKQSFLTRLEQTLHAAQPPKAKPKPVSISDPAAAFAEDIRQRFGEQLLRCEECWTERQDQPSFVVTLAGGAQQARQEVLQRFRRLAPEASSEEIASRLHIIDRPTADHLEQLARAGLIQLNFRARRDLLSPANETESAVLSPEERQRLEECHRRRDRKLKAAAMLVREELAEEAVPALREATLLTLQSAALQARSDEPEAFHDCLAPRFAPFWQPAEIEMLKAFAQTPAEQATPWCDALEVRARASETPRATTWKQWAQR